MKNILEILKEFGLEVPEDKKKDFEKSVLENYKTVKDYEVQTGKVEKLEGDIETYKGTVETLEGDLKKFDGVDVTELQGKITTLETDLKNKDAEYQNKIADRDFNDILKSSISDAKGKNVKAIQALLDVETLKASKNQKDDILAAIKALTEAEDSKMLFGEPDATPEGTFTPIGNVGNKKPNSQPSLKDALKEKYGE